MDDKPVGKYDNTGSFGELALMYNMPRAATIIATSEGIIWAMVSERLTISNKNTKKVSSNQPAFGTNNK